MKESEKLLERKIKHKVKSAGGLAIKLPAVHFAGIPDQLCLFPNGVAIFVEVKTTGMKPRKLQLAVHKRLRKLGFDVRVIDRSTQIEKLIEDGIERSKSS